MAAPAACLALAATAVARAHRTTLLAALLCMAGTGQPARAAIVLDGIMFDNGQGDAELAEPNGVDADLLGNVYVADHWTSRIVKFGKDGRVKRTMGGYGAAPDRLNGPLAVAVGETETFGTLVYVADQANGRITVFNEYGNYKATFEEAAGVHINGPGGVAFVENESGGGFLLVADSLNYRVVIFFPNGKFFKAYTCPTCPDGRILPAGIAGSVKEGVFRIYITDAFTGQVQVIDGSTGKWIRTIGKKWVIGGAGRQKGHLQAPDELAVDDEGNVWVADTGSAYGDAQRISKFDPTGKFLLEFHNAGGDATKFLSPHGVGIGDEGEIYVANTGRSDVYRFREEPPALHVAASRDKQQWLDSEKAIFFVTYNGVEQSCEGVGTARISVPIAAAEPFTVDGGPIRILHFGGDGPELKMRLTDEQVGWVRAAWNRGKQIDIQASFRATCQDGVRLRKSFQARL